MEKIFDSVRLLDKRAEETYNLKNGVLMEYAACGMAEHIRSFLKTKAGEKTAACRIQIICGSGDNGGDGFALARVLADFCTVRAVSVKAPKSPLCRLQKERLDLLGIPVHTDSEPDCDVLIDAVLGTGIRGALDPQMSEVIRQMNAVCGYKIACDIPSGLNECGAPSPVAFRADETYTMGALKTALYADTAKDYTGVVRLINLGLPRRLYETETHTFLLSLTDMHLPRRTVQNTHKMNYGHAVFFCGEKQGACVLAASAALRFGGGAVTVYGMPIPSGLPDFMYAVQLPGQFSAASIGSGLDNTAEQQSEALRFLEHAEVREKPLVLDAGILHNPELPALLPFLKQPVLTPHPKEFQSLLANSGLAQVSLSDIQSNRFFYVRQFCLRFPHAVLLLKGAYPLIGQNGCIYVNPLGGNTLAKAGTGDVLTGMITALAAQGYALCDAACTASLAHAEAARMADTGYGLLASDLPLLIAKLR